METIMSDELSQRVVWSLGTVNVPKISKFKFSDLIIREFQLSIFYYLQMFQFAQINMYILFFQMSYKTRLVWQRKKPLRVGLLTGFAVQVIG